MGQGGLPSRQQSADDGDGQAHRQRDRDDRPAQARALQQRHAGGVEQRGQPGQQPRTRGHAQGGADDADDDRLQEHHAEHGGRRGPDRPQQGELLDPLTHAHREGVHDDEGAHEHCDDDEDQQEDLNEAQLLLNGLVLLLDDLGAGPDLGAVGNDLGDLGLDGVHRGALSDVNGDGRHLPVRGGDGHEPVRVHAHDRRAGHGGLVVELADHGDLGG